jgi:hypothetical protein
MAAARGLALAAAACAAAGAALAGLPEDSLRQTVVGRCLPLFPQFLNPAGGDAAPAARTAPGRYLLDAGGAASFAAGEAGGPRCFVGHPGVPEPVARRHVEDVLREWFPTRWSRAVAADGAPVWRVAGQGATLEITVTSHGATGGTPGSGVGFAVR